MKGMLTLKKSAVIAAVCMAVLCVSGYSEPTPEQVKERTQLLCEAINSNNVEQAKVCIKLGADVNAKVYHSRSNYDDYLTTYKPYSDYFVYTPLIYAVEYNKSKDIIELLVKSGADVNAKGGGIDEKTAFMFAAKNGDKDIVELLIKAGADVNNATKSGWTALTFAAENGNKDVTELLIKVGADVNATSSGLTALMVAAENGNKDVAELLIKVGADVDAGLSSGWTALMRAVNKGHKDVVEFLIKAGADVNVKDSNPMTALMRAIDKDIAKLLIKAGADSGAALVWAIENDYDSITRTKFLIDAGADVNAKDSEGISVLTHAILHGKKEIADLLRAAGAKE